MIVALIVLLAGSTAEIASQKWQDWLGAAILVRLGVGLAQSILVTYIAELAPFQVRGMLIGAYQVLLTTGQLIVAGAAELVRIHRPNEWRVLIAIEFLFTGVNSHQQIPRPKLTQLRSHASSSSSFQNRTSTTLVETNMKKPSSRWCDCTVQLLITMW